MRLQNSLLALVLSTLIIPIGAEARYGSMSSAGASVARSSSSSSSAARVSTRTNTSASRTANSSRRVMAQNNNMVLMTTGVATAYLIFSGNQPKDYCSTKMFMDKTQARIPCLPKAL